MPEVNLRKYVPDLAAFDKFDSDDKMSLQRQMRVVRRNFELISRALRDLEEQQQIDSGSGGGVSPSPSLEEKNYYVQIWQLFDNFIIDSDNIIATTGVKLNGDSSLVIEGELKII